MLQNVRWFLLKPDGTYYRQTFKVFRSLEQYDCRLTQYSRRIPNVLCPAYRQRYHATSLTYSSPITPPDDPTTTRTSNLCFTVAHCSTWRCQQNEQAVPTVTHKSRFARPDTPLHQPTKGSPLHRMLYR